MTDEGIGRKIVPPNLSIGYVSRDYEIVGRNARELLYKPAAPMPPICGMTVEEIAQDFRAELAQGYNSLANVCARVAHRLAQPAPAEDADKDAKALAFIHWGQRSDSRQMMDNKTEEVLWEILSSDERNGWRAVVAALKKGAGDE